MRSDFQQSTYISSMSDLYLNEIRKKILEQNDNIKYFLLLGYFRTDVSMWQMKTHTNS